MTRAIVREATAVDIPAMHRLRLSVKENPLSPRFGIDQSSYVPFVLDQSAWVAEKEDRLAGFAVLDATIASVWALFVGGRDEGEGIGAALHNRMIDCAARRGISRLTLSTAPATRAEGFYRALGWSDAGYTTDGELKFERFVYSTSTPT